MQGLATIAMATACGRVMRRQILMEEVERMFFGTTVEGTVVRVIDGDTVRIQADGREASIRNLALDTEESNSGSPTKPQTPWGRAAKTEASVSSRATRP
jgi:endonuclease YncB( thermonuclease family)